MHPINMHTAADAFFDTLVIRSKALRAKAPGTLMQYKRTMRWFWAVWVRPMGRLPHTRAEVQQFLIGKQRPHLHHRVLQAVVNRHWDLPGPLVANPMRTCNRGVCSPKQQQDTLGQYLPRYIPQDFAQMSTLHALVALCNATPTNTHNVRYVVGIAYRWLLLASTTTADALTEAIIVRAKAATSSTVNRVITETTRVANLLAQLWGKPWRLCSAHVRNVFYATANCNDLIRCYTRETETKKRCDAVCARRAFSADEVAKLVTNAESMQDRSIIVILAHTGLRRRAVAWMQLAAVWDGSRVRTEGYTSEKGSQIRWFTIDSLMAQCLTDFIVRERRGGPSPWLFPSSHRPGQCIHPNTLALRLRQVCNRLGIMGQHVRPHGMRRYTVCTLIRAGNRIEDVSRWLGHRVVQTTYQNYWELSVHDISTGMTIPWLT